MGEGARKRGPDRSTLGAGISRASVAASLLFLWTACADDPGREAYLESGCPRCHGSDLGGTPLGPPLTQLTAVWTPDELDRFLADPVEARREDPRVDALARSFLSPMPRVALSDSARTRLVNYLLRTP